MPQSDKLVPSPFVRRQTEQKSCWSARRENHTTGIFPKGHQEKGETLAETAVRELKEEGGVVGKPLKSVGVSK